MTSILRTTGFSAEAEVLGLSRAVEFHVDRGLLIKVHSMEDAHAILTELSIGSVAAISPGPGNEAKLVPPVKMPSPAAKEPPGIDWEAAKAELAAPGVRQALKAALGPEHMEERIAAAATAATGNGKRLPRKSPTARAPTAETPAAKKASVEVFAAAILDADLPMDPDVRQKITDGMGLPDYDPGTSRAALENDKPYWTGQGIPSEGDPSFNGLICSDCARPQFRVSSGDTCANGHGGVLGIEPLKPDTQTADWITAQVAAQTGAPAPAPTSAPDVQDVPPSVLKATRAVTVVDWVINALGAKSLAEVLEHCKRLQERVPVLLRAGSDMPERVAKAYASINA